MQTRIDSLPPEILHRIFRLLLPETFYSLVPRLSKTLHDRSRGAIPGCPDHTISVDCDVRVEERNSRNFALPGVVRVLDDGFQLAYHPETGLPVWTSLSVTVTLSMKKMCKARDMSELFMKAVRDNFPTGRPKRTHNRQMNRVYRVNTPQDRLSNFLIARIQWGCWDSSGTWVPIWEWEYFHKSLRKLSHFVNTHRVEEVTLGSEFFESLDGLPSHASMDSVERLTVGNPAPWYLPEAISGMQPAPILSSALSRFPSAVHLKGDFAFFPVSHPGSPRIDDMRRLIPESLRNTVTSLIRYGGHWQTSTPSQYAFLSAPLVFPNLQELAFFNVLGSRSNTIIP
ncbi:hypothetical protein HDU93_004129 [Gonapodya sp. JEL0774]|nr:hypothetical protein HDU93_004129 [Gonapodya sp. JEL0774]